MKANDLAKAARAVVAEYAECDEAGPTPGLIRAIARLREEVDDFDDEVEEAMILDPGVYRFRMGDERDVGLAWVHLDLLALMSISSADIVGTRIAREEVDRRHMALVERGVKALFEGDWDAFARAAMSLGVRTEEDFNERAGIGTDHPMDAITVYLGAAVVIARSAHVTLEAARARMFPEIPA